MNEKLAHLSTEEISDLMKKYYEGEDSTNELIDEYKINITPSRLYTLFPNIVCEEICEYCGINLEMPAPSRTSAKSKYGQKKKKCPRCGHMPEEYICCCNKCKQKREQENREKLLRKQIEQQEQRRLIEDVYKFDVNSRLSIEEIDFVDRIYLGAVLRGFLSEDLSFIQPIDATILTPNQTFSSEIVSRLIRNSIIVVDSSSDIEAFVKNENFPNRFYTFLVKYRMNLELPSNINEFIKEIMYPKAIREEDKVQIFKLWKRIAIEECIQYLTYQLAQVKFEYSAGEKTYAVFEELLEYFSVSQIYGIIWRKVNDATRLYQEGNITKKHAANTVIGGCQTFGERARINNWELRKYGRIKELPQSIISEYLFNQVMKIGELGFQMPPTMP